MAINNFIFACSIDDSPGYFTYDSNNMLIIKSKKSSKSKINDFEYIEPFIESLISHESSELGNAKNQVRPGIEAVVKSL